MRYPSKKIKEYVECDQQATTESKGRLIWPRVRAPDDVGVQFSQSPIRPRLDRPEVDRTTQGTKDLLSNIWTIGGQG